MKEPNKNLAAVFAFAISLLVVVVLGNYLSEDAQAVHTAPVDERSEQEKRGLSAVQMQVDGYWCIVGYFGSDARPVSINCK